MIIRPDDASFPCYEDSEGKLALAEIGLTKRELLAAIALQGLLANPSRMEFPQDPYAVQAVEFADKLIEQLNHRRSSCPH